MKRIIFITLALWLLVLSTPLFAATYYVRKDGHDTNCAGTADASDASTETTACAWLTIAKCTALVGVNTCVVAASATPYDEYITEEKSGSAGNYIIYVSSPHADLTKNSTTEAAQIGGAIVRGFDIASESYVKIIGFQITHDSLDHSYGVNADHAHHVELLYNYIHHTNGTAFYLYSTDNSDNIFRGNRVEYLNCLSGVAGECLGAGGFSPKGDRNLIEYNRVSRILDYVTFSDADISEAIIRNNYLGYNAFADFPDNTHSDGASECTGPGTAADTTGAYEAACCTAENTGATCIARHIDGLQLNSAYGNILFERNYLEHGAATDITNKHAFLHSASSTTQTIMRENLLSRVSGGERNGGSGFRFYNNTAVNSTGSGVAYAPVNASTGGTASTDNKSFNNVFYNPSLIGQYVHCISNDDPPNDLIADYEVWYNYTAYDLPACTAVSTWTGGASQTQNTDPSLNADYTLPSDSSAKAAGVTLTLANGAAAEATDQLVVDDARPFIGQNWAVVDASGTAIGDTIIIGTNDPVVVESVDYATKTITLASAQTWADDATVRLSHQAATPDIGAYLYKTTYSLAATWSLVDGTVTVVPSDASLVRFVEVLENGIPIGVDYTSPYAVSGVGAGIVTVKVFKLYASENPIIAADEGEGTHRRAISGAKISGGSVH